MAGERLTRDRSIPVDLRSVRTVDAEGADVHGVGLTVRDEPYPTSIEVFPSMEHATIENDVFSLMLDSAMEGVQMGDSGFTIKSTHGEAVSAVTVFNDGRISFEYNPHPSDNKREVVPEVKQLESRSRALPRRQMLKSDPIFKDLSVDEPSTFEPLTFGQTLSFFRRLANLSQDELAVRADIAQKSITRYETGKNLPLRIRNLMQLIQGFEWEENDPRVQILMAKFEAEAEDRKLKLIRPRTQAK